METAAPPSNLNIANALTLLRIVGVPVFGWLLLSEGGDDVGFRIWSWVAFILLMITDRIDGDIARSRGLITDFGKIADPIADKLLIGSALVMLSLLGELPWWVTILILVREWGVTALRFFVIRYGVIPASRGGKLKTVIQTVAIFLYILPLASIAPWLGFVAFAVMMAALAITLWTGGEYVIEALKLRASGIRAQQQKIQEGKP